MFSFQPFIWVDLEEFRVDKIDEFLQGRAPTAGVIPQTPHRLVDSWMDLGSAPELRVLGAEDDTAHRPAVKYTRPFCFVAPLRTLVYTGRGRGYRIAVSEAGGDVVDPRDAEIRNFKMPTPSSVK